MGIRTRYVRHSVFERQISIVLLGARARSPGSEPLDRIRTLPNPGSGPRL
jgi:hypothetical protein